MKSPTVKKILLLGCILSHFCLLPMHEGIVPEQRAPGREKTSEQLMKEQKIETRRAAYERERARLEEEKLNLEKNLQERVRKTYEERAPESMFLEKNKADLENINRNIKLLTQLQEYKAPAAVENYKTVLARTTFNTILDRLVMIFDFLKPIRIKALENEKKNLENQKTPEAKARISEINKSLAFIKSNPDYKQYTKALQEFYKAYDRIEELQAQSSFLKVVKFDWKSTTPLNLLTLDTFINNTIKAMQEAVAKEPNNQNYVQHLEFITTFREALDSAVAKREALNKIEDTLIKKLASEIQTIAQTEQKKIPNLEKARNQLQGKKLTTEELNKLLEEHVSVANLQYELSDLIRHLERTQKALTLVPIEIKLSDGRAIQVTEDPYEILDLKRINNPNLATINVHRLEQLSKNPSKAEAVKKAYSILSDKPARKAYDEQAQKRDEALNEDPANLTEAFSEKLRTLAAEVISKYEESLPKPYDIAKQLLSALQEH